MLVTYLHVIHFAIYVFDKMSANILWVELYFRDWLYNKQSKYLSTAAKYTLLYVKGHLDISGTWFTTSMSYVSFLAWLTYTNKRSNQLRIHNINIMCIIFMRFIYYEYMICKITTYLYLILSAKQNNTHYWYLDCQLTFFQIE